MTSSVLTVSPQQQLGLADSFFEKADYAAAITEYLRFEYFFPDHARADYACFQIALSYYMRRDFEKALSLFERQCGRDVDDSYAVEACFMLSRCYMGLGWPDRAVVVLEALMASVDDIDVLDRAYYQIGWIYLESGTVLEAPVINRAGKYFSQISGKNQRPYKIDSLTGQLRDISTDRQGPLLSRKNPTLAGALAILPGAGYVYCGRYHDALMSFLFNSGMACAAWEAFDNDLEGLGALIGMVGLGFYSGSIYGSVSSAHKYNRTLLRDFLDRLDDTRVYFTPLQGGSGGMVSFHVPF